MSGVARKKLFYPLTILLEKSELIDIIISFFIRYKIFWILDMYLGGIHKPRGQVGGALCIEMY